MNLRLSIHRFDTFLNFNPYSVINVHHTSHREGDKATVLEGGYRKIN
jgi:hypothetical protein